MTTKQRVPGKPTSKTTSRPKIAAEVAKPSPWPQWARIAAAATSLLCTIASLFIATAAFLDGQKSQKEANGRMAAALEQMTGLARQSARQADALGLQLGEMRIQSGAFQEQADTLASELGEMRLQSGAFQQQAQALARSSSASEAQTLLQRRAFIETDRPVIFATVNTLADGGRREIVLNNGGAQPAFIINAEGWLIDLSDSEMNELRGRRESFSDAAEFLNEKLEKDPDLVHNLSCTYGGGLIISTHSNVILPCGTKLFGTNSSPGDFASATNLFACLDISRECVVLIGYRYRNAQGAVWGGGVVYYEGGTDWAVLVSVDLLDE